jgi:hypothetical protein
MAESYPINIRFQMCDTGIKKGLFGGLCSQPCSSALQSTPLSIPSVPQPGFSARQRLQKKNNPLVVVE